MIAVLPVLLYPLLGMLFLQITQFMQQQPTRIWVLGADRLDVEPPLFDGSRFAKEFCPADEARLLALSFAEPAAESLTREATSDLARREIRRDGYDALLVFPGVFSSQLSVLASATERPAAAARDGTPPAAGLAEENVPEILYNQAGDASRIAADRIERVVKRWRDAVARRMLAARGVAPALAKPFEPRRTDISEEVKRRAAVWARILPFVVVVWALTGAFYPAIDLCAGEKERGTLETLLCSPATRGEIVGGKLLTVVCFSVATAYLNLASLGMTGVVLIRQLGASTELGLTLDFGPPPVLAIVWLVLATLPVAVLFSALSLALAAFAQSVKEAQYYLMPLLLISFPLMTLPVLPTARLDLGTAIVPVTGMVLWLRQLVEGQYADAVRYAVPVLAVTLGCSWLAIRWAVRQFRSESVLFRQGEQVGLGLWLRHIVRDRGATPSVAEAMLCGLLILLATFFASLRAIPPQTYGDFARMVGVTQIGLIAAPVLIMTASLARSPRHTLLLTMPRMWMLPAALLLAIVLHPVVVLLAQGIEATYPISEDTLRTLERLSGAMQSAQLWQILLVVALLPAICEELAFRGFILSGLRHIGSPSAAIVISSVLFGLTHGLLQQSLSAIAVGLVMGYLALQTRSLLPSAVFHFTHNSLSVIAGRQVPQLLDQSSWVGWLMHPTGSQVVPFGYHWPVIALGAVASLAILMAFRRQAENQIE